jgi:hypothetical protein
MGSMLVTSEWVPGSQILRHTEEAGSSRNVTAMSSDKRCHQGGGENVGVTHYL